MSVELTMPALSPTMEKGTLSKWLVKEGDVVKAGDLLAEIETDKVMVEFAAVEPGILSRIVVADGTDDVPVGAVIAILRGGSESATTEEDAVSFTPDAIPAASLELESVRSSSTPTNSSAAPRVSASPLAQRIASAAGIDLANLEGRGADGKILKSDLPLGQSESRARAPSPAVDSNSGAYPPEPGAAPHQTIKLSAMRKVIARRLTEAKQTIPHFYLSVDVRIDALLEIRSRWNAALAGKGIKATVNDFMIKALATALEQNPEANVQYAGDVLYRFERVDVSLAVAVTGGLVTPVLTDVNRKPLRQVAVEARSLAERAREGRLGPEASQGGTVSLSNLGMFGIKEMIPVINPPQALVLGVGSANERPYAQDGKLIVATVMTATASFDHRAIDGAVGAAFLRSFKDIIEEPVGLLA
jgi:pyruvate dehydrogenase E2 component (dihydrolipoamide acetyltransferase)